MSRVFTPRLDILPPSQRRIWLELREVAKLGFVLYGGTAIALRLGLQRVEAKDDLDVAAMLENGAT